MKGGQWFYTEKSLVLILKMMINPWYLSPSFPPHTPNINGEEEVNDVHANRNDHDAGELINIL